MRNGPIRSIRVAIGPVAAGLIGEPRPVSPAPDLAGSFRTPLIDIHEGPEGLILEADLPGVEAEGLAVQVDETVLSLHGRPVPPDLGAARSLLEEVHGGEFRRSFILSAEVDRERISAVLRDGVLRVLLPRADRSRTRKIEVRSS